MQLNMKLFKIPKELHEVFQKIILAGGKVYLVGGAIRSVLLNKEPKDLDFCVTGLAWQEMEALFPGCKVQGNDFPVFVIEGCEFALARKERKVGVGHAGFETITDKSLTIYDDLIRRDFTINAMAIDMETEDFYDPHGGFRDIHGHSLRAVSPAFAEDPLRVYRAARFAAQLNFHIDEFTLKMMSSLRNELPHLTMERVTTEMIKALESDKPQEFFRVLWGEVALLHIHFPELYALAYVPQPEKYHKYDAFQHSLDSLRAAVELTNLMDVDKDKKSMFRFAALVHDLGKGVTPKDQWPKHNGHEAAGVPLVEAMGNRLKGIPKDWIKAGMVGAELHMRAYKWHELRPSKFVDMITYVAKTPLGLDGLMTVINADHMSRGFDDLPVSQANDIYILGLRMLKEVTGKTITVKEGITGKAFGEALRQARIDWSSTNEHVKVRKAQYIKE